MLKETRVVYRGRHRGRFYRKVWEAEPAPAPNVIKDLDHDALVAIVARMFGNAFTWQTEVRIGNRWIDLVARCGDAYWIGFEMKTSLAALRAELVRNPQKRGAGRLGCQEFYFVLREFDGVTAEDIPADCGLIVVCTDGAAKIVTPSPKMLPMVKRDWA